MNQIRPVAVLGYGWSGSSAVVDLLKELEGYSDLDTEFRIIKDPYGIVQLESSLIDNWDILTCDVAIKDFLWYAKYLSSAYPGNALLKRVMKPRLSYNKIICEDFFDISLDYIKSLVDFSYKGSWWFLDMKDNWFSFMWHKVLNKIHPQGVCRTMFLSKPTQEVFIKQTKKYLSLILNKAAEKKHTKNIILDQAISATNPEKALRYFDNIKVIIVDRDPRDIYVDLAQQNALIGADLKRENESVFKYLLWHKSLRQGKKIDSKNILCLDFESLVYDYQNTVNLILNFLGEKPEAHKYKKKYFDPDVSVNNVGIYKTWKNPESIQEIEKKLRIFK